MSRTRGLKRRVMSLRLRLFLVILSPLLVASVALGAWRLEVAKDTAQELFDRGLLAAALAIARDVAISEGDALSPRTRQLISDAGGGEVFYHVTGPGGIYVTGYAYPPTRVEDAGPGPSYMIAEYRGERVRVLRMTERTRIGALEGDTVVTVWQRMSDRDGFAAELALRAAALIAALMAILAVVVWFGVQLGLRPLNDLRDAIERRSPDDLSRIARPTPVELSGVLRVLNRLFGEVERSIEAQKAFISDAAHQLRNPASALLSLAEALPEARSEEERRGREREVIAAARKSARLTDQLLSLERLRHGGVLRRERFDLSALAEEICADMAPALFARELDFAFRRGEGPLPVEGDRVLVGEALRNLIDNALRHGGPGLTGVEVETAAARGMALVRVIDDGRGIPPEYARAVFRRFAQVEPGRGSGLGLAIVQEVASAHGGAAQVERAERGARLALHLPRAPDEA